MRYVCGENANFILCCFNRKLTQVVGSPWLSMADMLKHAIDPVEEGEEKKHAFCKFIPKKKSALPITALLVRYCLGN